ncbi:MULTISPECIES: inositol monophosphatase family protein [Microbacterium]|uniref:inositol monophosphatase family protein n=1 Tax=Microbacterium TaxID=33882 RepID=UPI0023DB7686|nr:MULTISPECIES: inositol monophosphatase family protein [Microbacterium]MDF2046367.1 inositol monophosphatase family protein [Microbacterium sp. Kw_RZR3]MDQ1075848.1 myo-inositol-1(or 4)-monophosphatase [Microbacterium sp. SORGH_AS_0969]MDQ1116093.1 myo-inositol-1(or 4)-monophosphatase [Microbacterium testaceum]
MTLAAELLDIATRIAREAGDLARRRREEGVTVAATKSAAADIVTAADREVEAFVRAELERVRPGDGFFGEESAATESATGVTWVVDPIDGTVNYAYGIPAWAVSIAAVEGPADPAEWVALAGAVYNPLTGEMFRASRGGGAWLGDTRLAVTNDVGEAGGLVATGFGYDPATHPPTLAQLGRVMPIARDVRRIGAASLDLASVAAGRMDAYYEKGTNPWDHAAGALLVEEAGGMLGGAPGGRPGKGMVIAAGPAFFPRLEELLDYDR